MPIPYQSTAPLPESPTLEGRIRVSQATVDKFNQLGYEGVMQLLRSGQATPEELELATRFYGPEVVESIVQDRTEQVRFQNMAANRQALAAQPPPQPVPPGPAQGPPARVPQGVTAGSTGGVSSPESAAESSGSLSQILRQLLGQDAFSQAATTIGAGGIAGIGAARLTDRLQRGARTQNFPIRPQPTQNPGMNIRNFDRSDPTLQEYYAAQSTRETDQRFGRNLENLRPQRPTPQNVQPAQAAQGAQQATPDAVSRRLAANPMSAENLGLRPVPPPAQAPPVRAGVPVAPSSVSAPAPAPAQAPRSPNSRFPLLNPPESPPQISTPPITAEGSTARALGGAPPVRNLPGQSFNPLAGQEVGTRLLPPQPSQQSNSFTPTPSRSFPSVGTTPESTYAADSPRWAPRTTPTPFNQEAIARRLSPPTREPLVGGRPQQLNFGQLPPTHGTGADNQMIQGIRTPGVTTPEPNITRPQTVSQQPTSTFTRRVNVGPNIAGASPEIAKILERLPEGQSPAQIRAMLPGDAATRTQAMEALGISRPPAQARPSYASPVETFNMTTPEGIAGARAAGVSEGALERALRALRQSDEGFRGVSSMVPSRAGLGRILGGLGRGLGTAGLLASLFEWSPENATGEEMYSGHHLNFGESGPLGPEMRSSNYQPGVIRGSQHSLLQQFNPFDRGFEPKVTQDVPKQPTQGAVARRSRPEGTPAPQNAPRGGRKSQKEINQQNNKLARVRELLR